MRLLRRCDTGEYSLTEYLDGSEAVPPYAILSHTWGADAEEVTFEDITSCTGKDKSGYEKIRFCEKQAIQDGLDYFWIDTCCINKANKAELSKAINSMFRWYCNAARCYVYLSDVSTAKRDADGHPSEWESAFRRSRWFTRGWTLQELLAPSSVEFFSRQHKRLGDKSSLRQQIHEITAVPVSALQGALLSQFSVNSRLSWIENRQSKLEEDRAYSLLGIFDVYIPPIYGEGIGRAFQRLQDEINKVERCLQDVRLTDPSDDKKRIEDTKGGLLEDSYLWILENSDFQQWRNNQLSRLLWIKGDPGKGKTMLLCGIINELKKSRAKTDLLSYFFCQATDSRINNAIAVLRGLIYLLVDQQPSLVSHIQKKHNHAGRSLFGDVNAWIALTEIFTDMLQDPNLNSAYIVIDALDECVTDLRKLLDFIVLKSAGSSRVKWIVSSRNWPDIKERLEIAGHQLSLCLELNPKSISTAVHSYIQHKVTWLAQKKKYNDTIRNAVLNHLFSNADNTFLWVALVCQNLGNIPQWKVLTKLKAFPPGLDSLYERMIEQIRKSDDADLCTRILSVIAIVYRPITIKELTSLVEAIKDIDYDSIPEIISLCGSFLTIRDNTIYFVHQSAKDFLFTKAYERIFPSGAEEAHHMIFSESLQVMSRTLRRDMYSLRAPGYPIERVEVPCPDPLATIRYSCIYWVDHLCERNPNSSLNLSVDLENGGAVDRFLRSKYLYWLESLSLCKSISKGVISMMKLEKLIKACLK